MPGFITKVYSILAIQLGFTVLCCGVSMYYDPIRLFMVGSGMLCFYAALIASIVLLISLYCNKNSYPLNAYLLGCFTFCESWLVGTICALYQQEAEMCLAKGNAGCSNLGLLIWIAWGITFAIFGALTAFVVISKWDFSFMGMYLFAGALIMMGWGLLNIILGWHGSFIYGACGAALMSGYIIYDTDNIMKRMGPDDWALACCELYLDIINLFLFILDMLNSS
jgi:FtsH-binding integral membrane protein